jgi:hypothetical protein
MMMTEDGKPSHGLELLALSIERELHFEAERASEIISQIKQRGLTFEMMDSPPFFERPARPAEIEAAAQLIEARFVANQGLAPLTPLCELSAELQDQWAAVARRFYSNSVLHPIELTEQLYQELDGELPEPLQVAPADLSFTPYSPDFCVEWHPPGQLPAHRAQVMAADPMVYPLAVTVTVHGFEPSSVRAKEGRIWPLGLIYLDGKLHSPRELQRRAWAQGAKIREMTRTWPNPASCYLVEVFGNHGDDGWTHYTLDGYAVMTGPQLAEHIGQITGRSHAARKGHLETILDSFGKR